MNENFCPVCGYRLSVPAWENEIPSDDICPCCGTQFGYDDAIRGLGEHEKTIARYLELRSNWLDSGMKWWAGENSERNPPVGWDPKAQLKNINFIRLDSKFFD